MSYGLMVGEFHDTEEVVVKPLGQRLKHLKEYSGATILGDGTVALILDVAGIAVKAGLSSVAGSMRAAELAAALEAERYKDIHAMLLFHNGPEEQCAISLDLVQRIERISPSQVEHIGQLRTMQYRGRSLPLVALSDTAKVHTLDDEQDLVVLVTNACGREVGLLCSMPVDVIETQIEVDQTTHRQKGIAGSAIFRERTTLIADLFELVDTAYPDWRQDRMEAQPLGKLPADGGSTVLLVEDSDFFRQQIRKYLEQEGFKVLTASDGEVGWDTLLKNIASVRVVVTDIEMPRLNGLGLTARIRADNRTANLPVIAVTSLAGDEDAERGLAAGVNEYQVKLDRDRLVASIRSRMGDSG
jgi:two-component system chemotaxis sensor kinase CheA